MGPGWRKSTFSGDGGNDNCVEVWRRSSFSGGGGNDNCVEVSMTGIPSVAVRDSKHSALVIRVPSPAWDFFLRELS
jgi:hypothetical protein